MDRRNFLKSASVLTAAGLAGPQVLHSQSKKTIENILPPRLKKGDTIGLIAPGSFINEDELQESVNNLENLGYKVKYSEKILSRYGYLGGADKIRAEEINNMFSDNSVDGIVCARGGYGCARILDMIDYNLIRKNPKVLTGYSDITALLYAIYSQTGLVCFHGPVGISTFNEFSTNYFTRALSGASSETELVSSAEDQKDIYTIKSGRAEGILAGGNLSIVVSLMGTKYDIDPTGKILFLEEIGEEPYRIDRMLTQLILSGNLKNAAGIALGRFRKCDPKEEDKSSFSLKEVLYDRLYELGIPVIYGLSFGHVTDKFTLPVGTKARLDTGRKKITLLDYSVN